MVAAPGSGIAIVESVRAPTDRVVVTERSMNNGLIAVSWNLDGEVTSIIDVLRGRELLPAGRRITLDLAPDHPVEYDAWDLESWTGSLGASITTATTVELVASHPLLAELVVCRRFGESAVTQTYTLRAGSARLDIAFDIDWHENEQLLSVMVPLDVRAREAICDIQFGQVDAPDPCQQFVGRRQVRGVRASVRRHHRAVVRCRRPQQRTVRPRRAGGRSPCVAAARRQVPRPRCRSRPACRDHQRAAAWPGTVRGVARGRGPQPAASSRLRSSCRGASASGVHRPSRRADQQREDTPTTVRVT